MFEMGDIVSFKWYGKREGMIVSVEENDDMVIVYSQEIDGWNLSRHREKTRRAVELGLLTQEEAEEDWFWAVSMDGISLIRQKRTIEWID